MVLTFFLDHGTLALRSYDRLARFLAPCLIPDDSIYDRGCDMCAFQRRPSWLLEFSEFKLKPFLDHFSLDFIYSRSIKTLWTFYFLMFYMFLCNKISKKIIQKPLKKIKAT